MTKQTETPRFVKLLYLSAALVFLLTGTLRASWPYGCCSSTSDCVQQSYVCCDKPKGWDACTTYWGHDVNGYCAPSSWDCDRAGGGIGS